MVEAAVNQGSLSGIRIAPSAPVISNLCFADVHHFILPGHGAGGGGGTHYIR